MVRVCRKCDDCKPIEEFAKKSGGLYGRDIYCDACMGRTGTIAKPATPDGFKYCGRCKLNQAVGSFKSGKAIHCWCQPCRRQYQEDRSRKLGVAPRGGNRDLSLIDLGLRECLKCHKVKSVKYDFYRSRTGFMGLHSYCKTCNISRVIASNKKELND